MDPFLDFSSTTSDVGVTKRFIKMEMLKERTEKSGLISFFETLTSFQINE